MRRILSLLLTLLLAVSCAGCEGRTQSPEELLELGIRYLDDGSYEEAILTFTSLLEIDPKQTQAYLGRARAYQELGGSENLAAAQADCEAALALDDSLTEAWQLLIDIHLAQEDSEKASEVLDDAVAATEDTEAFQSRAEQLQEAGALTEEQQEEFGLAPEEEDGDSSSDESGNEEEKLVRINYYGPDGTPLYYEDFFYYDTGLLCARTLGYLSSSNVEGEIITNKSGVCTVLDLYDSAGNRTGEYLDPVFLTDWVDQQNGVLSFEIYERDTTVVISPLTESIGQEKFGVDPSRTEEIFDVPPTIPSRDTDGWASAYLQTAMSNPPAGDTVPGCQFLFVNDDAVPELIVDGVFMPNVCIIYTAAGGAAESIQYLDYAAEWIPRSNRLHIVYGRQGLYGEDVYEIQNGAFTTVFGGEYNWVDTLAEPYEADGTPVYEYSIDGAVIPEEEYRQRFSAVFDESLAEDNALMLPLSRGRMFLESICSAS